MRFYDKGQEFGSHAVGHFDANEQGKVWSESDWTQEFQTYNDLFQNVARNNGPSGVPFKFKPEEIRGFRAPYLEYNDGLDATLKQFRYTYDTSRNGEPDSWPMKHPNNFWLFKLANVAVPGHPTRTLSMDYNFFKLQSNAEDDPDDAKRQRYRQEMLDAYLAYFKSNYEGNRAPVHIGHHFADYQRGAYKEALMAFATRICVLPEVRCVTYSELARYLDGLPGETLQAYQRGEFEKPQAMAALDLSSAFARMPPLISLKVVGGEKPHTLQASLAATDQHRFGSGKFEWSRFGTKVATGRTLRTSHLEKNKPMPVALMFRDSKGKVRWQNTFSVLVTGNETKILAPPSELERQ